jgi:hypothetical protein
MYLPEVWGPPYWFVMYTVAMIYPDDPTAATKRRYYDFFMNMPQFLPDADCGEWFRRMLDEYPISTYLDKKDSLLHWISFVHNKINARLGKPQVSFVEGMQQYKNKYRTQTQQLFFDTKLRRRWVTWLAVVVVLLLVLFYYK